MKTPNTQLMKQAREALKGRWLLVICTFFVYMLLMSLASIPEHHIPAGIQPLFAYLPFVWLVFLYGPFWLGVTTFSLAVARNQEPKLCMLFAGFKQNYLKSIGVFLLMFLFMFLGLLLFIIPGFIVIAMLALVFFILHDNPQIGVWQALKQSKKMMVGFKAKYIGLMLMFLGLMILAYTPLVLALVAGLPFVGFLAFVAIPAVIIGTLCLIPFMQITLAKFYEDVKAHNTDMA